MYDLAFFEGNFVGGIYRCILCVSGKSLRVRRGLSSFFCR